MSGKRDTVVGMRMFRFYGTSARPGFTIMEMMLVMGITAVISVIVLAAINPSKQLSDSRDSQRRVYVREIEAAMEQYVVKGNTMPVLPTIKAEAIGICKPGVTCTATGVDLTVLVPEYMVYMPEDPDFPDHEQTGFCVYVEGNTFYRACNPRLDVTCGASGIDCP